MSGAAASSDRASRAAPSPGPLWALVAFFALSIPGVVVWVLLQHYGLVDPTRGPDGMPGRTTMAWGFACNVGNAAAVLWLARAVPCGVPWGSGARLALRAYGLFVLPWIAVLVGYLVLLRGLGSPVTLQPHLLFFAVPAPGEFGFWLGLLVAVGLGPLAEEIVFRGYVQGALTERLGTRLGIVATAAAFGLVHGLDKALPLALLGLLFGWLRERTGGLLAPFVAHAVHNAVTVAVVLAWPSHLELLYPQPLYPR